MTTDFYTPHIFSCTNTRPEGHPRGSCGGSGGEALRQYMREKLKTAGLSDARANMAGCMDQCENGPALVIYPEGIWYSAKTTADIDRIVDEHLVGGKIVSDLQLMKKIKR
jgi:(2Fe-2S) ferredoxin